MVEACLASSSREPIRVRLVSKNNRPSNVDPVDYEKGFRKMVTKKTIQHGGDLRAAADKRVQDLAKVAFANILDFARFDADGGVHIFDYDKAREVGAKVTVVTRKVGRGKNARELRRTRIIMPDKFRALMQLIKHLTLAETDQ
jgi:hypothetical protein